MVSRAVGRVRATFSRRPSTGTGAQCALQVATEVGGLADTWKRAPLQALARLHTVAMTGRVPADELGRPRADAGVSERLDDSGRCGDGRPRRRACWWPAVVHAELMALRPFGVGGRTRGAGGVTRGAGGARRRPRCA